MAKKKKHKTKKKKQDPFIQAIIDTSIILVFTTMVVFVAVNIMTSQLHPSLFQRMVNEEQNAIISFYAIARDAELNHELFRFVKTDASIYAQDLNEAGQTRQELIAHYKSLLQSNPIARDVLYA